MLLKDALKAHRIKNRLTQKELAKKLHLKQYTISDYETGRIEPSLPILIRYADFFHISLDELVFHTPRRTSEAPAKEETDLAFDRYTIEFNSLIEPLSEKKKKKLMELINFFIDQYLNTHKEEDS